MESLSDFFRFKRFKVRHSSSYKVNTDGVLLGVWMNLPENGDSLLLEIGCGCGVISLIASQRAVDSSVKIKAVEIDKASAEEAMFNVENCGLCNDIEVIHSAIQNYLFETCEASVGADSSEVSAGQESKFDLIFSNPPYFNNSLKSPDRVRSDARHTDTLPHDTIIEIAAKHLTDNGRLAIILPVDEAEAFITQSDKQQLFLRRLCKVSGGEGKPAKRYLMEFSKEDGALKEETLSIQDKEGNFTSEYKALTKEFYLNF